MTDSDHVKVGDFVEITLISNPSKRSKGIVDRILSNTNSDITTIVLRDGDKGNITKIINSLDMIKKRIMFEDQHTENKENFSKGVMRNESIPQAIQSFLNSEGGYLYIGIKDAGELKQRLVGLNYDFEQINEHETKTNDRLCDEFTMSVFDSLNKRLVSDLEIGSFVKINFIIVDDVQIAEIIITPSPKPWFFRHLTKNNKEQEFELRVMNDNFGKRVLDDFYIRNGGSKRRLDTHEQFYKYLLNHFHKSLNHNNFSFNT